MYIFFTGVKNLRNFLMNTLGLVLLVALVGCKAEGEKFPSYTGTYQLDLERLSLTYSDTKDWAQSLDQEVLKEKLPNLLLPSKLYIAQKDFKRRNGINQHEVTIFTGFDYLNAELEAVENMDMQGRVISGLLKRGSIPGMPHDVRNNAARFYHQQSMRLESAQDPDFQLTQTSVQVDYDSPVLILLTDQGPVQRHACRFRLSSNAYIGLTPAPRVLNEAYPFSVGQLADGTSISQNIVQRNRDGLPAINRERWDQEEKQIYVTVRVVKLKDSYPYASECFSPNESYTLRLVYQKVSDRIESDVVRDFGGMTYNVDLREDQPELNQQIDYINSHFNPIFSDLFPDFPRFGSGLCSWFNMRCR